MNIIHPTHIRPLQAELLSTTALTPTQHKSRGIGIIIGIAASIAIPFAAPMIASSFLASAGIAAAAGSFAATASTALVGALLTTGVAYASGARGKGLILAGIGGGIASGISGYNVGALGKGSGVGFGANVAPGGVLPNAPSSQVAGTAGLGSTTDGMVLHAKHLGELDPALAQFPVEQSFVDPGAGFRGPHANWAADNSGVFAYGSNATFGPGSASYTPVMAGNAGADPSYINKLMTSEPLKAAGSQLLGKALGGFAVGDSPDMSAEEKAANANLAESLAFQKAARDRKLGISKDYVRMASNINPAYYGQQALTQEQNRLLRAQQAGLRKIGTRGSGNRASTVRRNALDKSRLGGYDRGRQEAEAKRLQYMQAAQGSSPTGAGVTRANQQIVTDADKRYDRLKDAGQEWTDVAIPVFDEMFGLDKKKKLKKKKLGEGVR